MNDDNVQNPLGNLKGIGFGPSFLLGTTNPLSPPPPRLLGQHFGNPLLPAIEKTFTPPNPGEIITFKGRRYYLGNIFAAGNFGAVYECTDDWGNDLAAKIFLPQNQPYDRVKESWVRELKNLVELRHPNITYVYDAFECRDTFYIIIERCSETLEQLIHWPELIPELWIKPISKRILEAIHFIHAAGYVHKDIHPGNIYTNFKRCEMQGTFVTQFKLGDLGISRLEPDIRPMNTVFARWMLAPEFLNPPAFGRIGKSVDIYHAGMVFLSILLKEIPTFTESEILQGRPRMLAEQLSSPYSAAIARALRRHVSERTSSALEFWHEINTSI